MKRVIVFFSLILTAIATRADFVIQQKMESPMMNGTMAIKIKGDKIRVDLPAGPMGSVSTIMNLSGGDATTLLHSQKMAMKISAAQIKERMQEMKSRMNNGSTNVQPPKLQDTGKTEMVAGYSAEIYAWTNSNNASSGQIWIARKFPNYALFQAQLDKVNDSPAGQMSKGMTPDTSKIPGMVVKTETELEGQKITVTLVSARQEPVDASAFEIPKDYQQISPPPLNN
jgi:hypothetical protein